MKEKLEQCKDILDQQLTFNSRDIARHIEDAFNRLKPLCDTPKPEEHGADMLAIIDNLERHLRPLRERRTELSVKQQMTELFLSQTQTEA